MVQLFWFHCSIKLDVTKKKDLNRLLDIGSATTLNENTTQKVRGEGGKGWIKDCLPLQETAVYECVV